jgi:hypothetical protein
MRVHATNGTVANRTAAINQQLETSTPANPNLPSAARVDARVWQMRIVGHSWVPSLAG